MTETDKRIRLILVQALIDSYMTQESLGAELGVSRQAVNAILRGDRGLIPRSLLALVDVLGLEFTLTRKSGPVD